MAFRRSGSRPSRIASPSRSAVTLPMSSELRAQPRLAEFPPDTVSDTTPKVASNEPASDDKTLMFSSSGETPHWQARLVPIPRMAILGSRSTCSTKDGSWSGRMPSRRSPSSTIRRTPWMRPCLCAQVESRSITLISVLWLISVDATTRSAWLIMGDRIRVNSHVSPARRIASMFSMRASPIEVTPALSIVLAISGRPRTALVTPVTLIPRTARRSTSVLALWWIRSSRISNLGAVMQRPRSGSFRPRERPVPPFLPAIRQAASARRSRECPGRVRTRRSPR